jgi:hypothetical protein
MTFEVNELVATEANNDSGGPGYRGFQDETWHLGI